ncbi:Pentatricopeptide repeat-containing protein [Quillaja saponaria]|uniref:Pentatricopeptide repeat-containing protein n=1 Tax=Quillaja saponaria TaxID=32244 RepID=A0AAD7L5C2_QUISA|nr:Pentatricopeptide repeat-containing protein [Quillaja saponaria]
MLNAASLRFVSVPSRFPPKYFTSPSFSQTQSRTCQFCNTDNELVDFFDHLLKQCRTVQQSQQIHTQIVVTSAHQSAFLDSRLVTAYARFGFVMDARKVFDATPVECLGNLLLWNSILRANVTHGYYQNAVELYVKMRNLGVLGDGFTFPLIIRACAFMGSSNLSWSIHSHALQMGLQNHLHVVNELMGMYGKLGRMVEARQLFDRMGVRSHLSWNVMVSNYALNYDPVGASEIFRQMKLEGLLPNTVTWTSLLSSHARSGQYEETIELFVKMRVGGFGINAEALAVVLSVCADLAAVDGGRMVHGYIVKGGYEDYLFVKNALICMYGKNEQVKDAQKMFLLADTKNLVTWNALISAYAESGLCDEAFAVFSELHNLDDHLMVRPNVISWSAVIGGCASKGRNEDSLELFRRMQLAEVMANSVTISIILSVCAELAAVNLGREIHGHMVRALMDSNILVGNGLINMYMKSGSFKQGHMVFDKIDSRDLISWNSIIAGYGIHGLGENALRTFDQMIVTGLQPDNVTFVAVLSACSHAGLVSEARKLFDVMVGEFRIEPQMEHYACMVDLLGRAGLLQEASNIMKNMPMEPNECVLETTGSYMLLSNLYAACGRWKDSARVRVSAKAKGLKKTPGQSWIEVKKKVYTFSAGKVVQPGLDEVPEIVKELALQMESEETEHCI